MLFFKSKFDWVKQRAKKDFQTIYSKSNNGKKLAIISIDMQKDFLKQIQPKIKRKILIIYHKELKKLSKKNNIHFIEIEYDNYKQNVLRDSSSNYFIKNSDSIAFNDEFIDYLFDNKIQTLYLIGINRNACVLSSIYFLADAHFKVITSFLGTGSSEDSIYLIKNKTDVNTINQEYKDIYNENNISNVSLANNIVILIKNGVEILDYHQKEQKEIEKKAA